MVCGLKPAAPNTLLYGAHEPAAVQECRAEGPTAGRKRAAWGDEGARQPRWQQRAVNLTLLCPQQGAQTTVPLELRTIMQVAGAPRLNGTGQLLPRRAGQQQAGRHSN